MGASWRLWSWRQCPSSMSSGPHTLKKPQLLPDSHPYSATRQQLSASDFCAFIYFSIRSIASTSNICIVFACTSADFMLFHMLQSLCECRPRTELYFFFFFFNKLGNFLGLYSSYSQFSLSFTFFWDLFLYKNN